MPSTRSHTRATRTGPQVSAVCSGLLCQYSIWRNGYLERLCSVLPSIVSGYNPMEQTTNGALASCTIGDHSANGSIRSRWSHSAQGTITHTVTAVLYPVVRGRARLIRLPVHVHDDDSAGPSCEDVQFGRWFPFDVRLRRVDTIAGSTFCLINDYTIVTSLSESSCPLNGTLRDQMGLFVRGNVVVLRHCSRNQLRVCRVSRAEMRFIDLVVQR